MFNLDGHDLEFDKLCLMASKIYIRSRFYIQEWAFKFHSLWLLKIMEKEYACIRLEKGKRKRKRKKERRSVI
jgi:hypothetical protein